MPIYIYQHPDTQEAKEIVQGMNDIHEYTDEKGIKWNRIFTVPQGSVDGKFNCWSQAKFVEKTGNMKGTMGDVWDMAKEASEQRAREHGGIDPVQQKYFKEYARIRKGKRHPNDTHL